MKNRPYQPLTSKNRPLIEKLFTNFPKCSTMITEKQRKGGNQLKIRIELSDSDEIVIRCREQNEKVYALRSAIEDMMRGENEIMLTIGATEHFVPKNDVLFFESSEGKVYAHTADRMYTAPYKLFELEAQMPSFFVRISKSAIANIHHISSIRREVVGNGELTFRRCDKKVYFSRAYYKLLQYKMEEMRLMK